MFIASDTFGLIEVSLHRFAIEASTLGLAPGQFPGRINTSMGNGQQFIMTRRDADGTHHYEQTLGCISLAILND